MSKLKEFIERQDTNKLNNKGLKNMLFAKYSGSLIFHILPNREIADGEKLLIHWFTVIF